MALEAKSETKAKPLRNDFQLSTKFKRSENKTLTGEITWHLMNLSRAVNGIDPE